MNNNNIIAVAGKGGVGKTAIAASLVRLLAEHFPDKRLLAIDADPAVGLSTALGIEVETTLDDVRKSIVFSVENGNKGEAVEMLNEAKYRILDTMVEKNGFNFIAIGRPESAGCYCKVNAYLKEVISLLADDFDFVVIDGEAGVEQINRRVMEQVTHLILITDQSKRGVQVIETIRKVADELTMYNYCGVVVNRVTDMNTVDSFNTQAAEILEFIPSDNEQIKNDMLGLSVFELSSDSSVIRGTENVLKKMGLIG